MSNNSIRNFKFKNINYYVVIDIIKGGMVPKKASKAWSDWKKKNDAREEFKIIKHKIKSANGRHYKLDCVSEDYVQKIKDVFFVGKKSTPEVAEVRELKIVDDTSSSSLFIELPAFEFHGIQIPAGAKIILSGRLS